MSGREDRLMRKHKKADDARKKAESNDSGKKTGKGLLRIVIVVLLLAVTLFGTLFVMDRCSKSKEETDTSFITISVLGDEIKLEDGTRVSYSEFEKYIENLYKKGELTTVALITDTANPPDTQIYNSVVALLNKYDIQCTELKPKATAPISSTADETATSDEQSQ